MSADGKGTPAVPAKRGTGRLVIGWVWLVLSCLVLVGRVRIWIAEGQPLLTVGIPDWTPGWIGYALAYTVGMVFFLWTVPAWFGMTTWTRYRRPSGIFIFASATFLLVVHLVTGLLVQNL